MITSNIYVHPTASMKDQATGLIDELVTAAAVLFYAYDPVKYNRYKFKTSDAIMDLLICNLDLPTCP